MHPIYTKSSQICAYADDVVIITRSAARIKQVYRAVEEKLPPPQMGLIANEKKTKYMIIAAAQKGRQIPNQKVGDKEFERVSPD